MYRNKLKIKMYLLNKLLITSNDVCLVKRYSNCLSRPSEAPLDLELKGATLRLRQSTGNQN